MADEPRRPVPLLARMSLRTKVALLLLILSLTPVLVTGGVAIHLAQEEGERNEQVRYRVAAASTAQALGELAASALREAQLLARRFPVELELSGQDRASAAWEAAHLLHEFNDADQTTFVAQPDGRLVFTVPFRKAPDLDLSATPWFNGLVPHGGVATGELGGLTFPGQPALIAVAPIRSGDHLVGYVGVAVHAPRLTDLVRTTTQGLAGPVEVFDGADQVILTTERQAAGPLGLFTRDPLRLFKRGQAEGTLQVHHDEEWLVTWASVPSVSLIVQVRVPVAVAYRHLNILAWLLFSVLALTFVFVVLFADYLATVLLRPIQELERGAEMLGAGQLDFRVEVADHANDELGRLAATFNRMGERLQASHKEVRAYSRSLETANEELDALVHGISHDLKRSLRNIHAFATFLHEDHAVALGTDGRQLAQSIVQVVDRLQVFTDDLIKLVERERVRGEASHFALRDVVEEARARVLERRPGLIEIEGELPEIHADRLQLVMMFENLPDNALKFNHRRPPRARVRCLDDGPDWRIEIEDDGIGIEPEHHREIFELFRRLNPPDDYPGAGTGLNLVRRIVEDHRGSIEVRSQPGEGSCFAISLPKEPMLLTLPGIRI